jgi:hypothetical protein
MGNFQKYWSQNVGQDFIVLDFFVGGRSCGRKRCVREFNVSRIGDPVNAGDKALMRETPAQRGRVNRYGLAFIKGNLVVQNVFYFLKSGLISGVTFGRSDFIRGDTVLSHITSGILLIFICLMIWGEIGRLQNKPWHFSDCYTLLYNTVKHVLSHTSLWPSYAFGIDRCSVYLVKDFKYWDLI